MGGRHGHARLAGAASAVVALAGCVAAPGPLPAVTSSPLPAVDCTAGVRTGPLPTWARAGFRDGGSSFHHVEGLQGRVVGVVFGFPLTSPPRPSRENKIAWVARDPSAAALSIEARLDGTGPVVQRDVGFGGGQSIVDLPQPGCWRLTLHWGDDLSDVVDLPYVSPP